MPSRRKDEPAPQQAPCSPPSEGHHLRRPGSEGTRHARPRPTPPRVKPPPLPADTLLPTRALAVDLPRGLRAPPLRRAGLGGSTPAARRGAGGERPAPERARPPSPGRASGCWAPSSPAGARAAGGADRRPGEARRRPLARSCSRPSRPDTPGRQPARRRSGRRCWRPCGARPAHGSAAGGDVAGARGGATLVELCVAPGAVDGGLGARRARPCPWRRADASGCAARRMPPRARR